MFAILTHAASNHLSELAEDKRTSLFCLNVSNNEEKSFIRLPPEISVYYETNDYLYIVIARAQCY
jgi:hypothetical protein